MASAIKKNLEFEKNQKPAPRYSYEDAYQRFIDEGLQEALQYGETRYFSDEYIWALSELGINVPEGSYEIFDPNNPPTPQGPNTGT